MHNITNCGATVKFRVGTFWGTFFISKRGISPGWFVGQSINMARQFRAFLGRKAGVYTHGRFPECPPYFLNKSGLNNLIICNIITPAQNIPTKRACILLTGWVTTVQVRLKNAGRFEKLVPIHLISLRWASASSFH